MLGFGVGVGHWVSTHDPPCEQLLAGVDVGAVLSPVVGRCRCSS